MAQVFTRHTALGLESFFCEMYYPYFSILGLSLLRRSFDADPISPLQPQAAYYVTRNLATMLDGLEPGELPFEIDSAPPHLETFALESPDGPALALWLDGPALALWLDGPALALWLGGHAKDHCEGVAVDVRLKMFCRKAIGYDPMNGVAQELRVAQGPGGTLLKGLLVHDWPLVIRLTSR